MQISAIALGGMTDAQNRLESTARRIASAGDPGNTADTVDLSSEMVALIQSRNDFAVNVKAAQTGDEMQQTLLDMMM